MTSIVDKLSFSFDRGNGAIFDLAIKPSLAAVTYFSKISYPSFSASGQFLRLAKEK